MNRAKTRRNKRLADKSAKKINSTEESSSILAEQGPPLAIQQVIDLAVQHHQAGDLLKAEGLYQQILQADPNQPIALHFLGLLSHQTGESNRAVQLIGNALKIKPDYAEAHCNLGLSLKDLGRFDEAVASYIKALAIRPDSALVHSNMGIALKALGQLDQAVASYKKALAIKPDYAEAYSNLGNALRELGQLDEAVENFHKAIVFNPNYAEAYFNRGLTLYALGKLDEAVASYNMTLAIKPSYAEAHYNLGNVIRDMGILDEAVTSYNKAITIKPDYAEAYSNLGNVLKDLGKLDEAMASYNKAITIEPDFVDVHNNLGLLHHDLGKFDKAEVNFNMALSLKPDLAEAHYNLGNTLKDLRKLDAAVACYKKSIVIKSDFAEAYSNLGNILITQGKLEDALKSFNMVQTPYSQAKILECLYALEQYSDFYLKLDKLIKDDTTNIAAASISAFASQQLDRADPYPFCKKSMDSIHVYSCLEGAEDTDKFLCRLVDELENRTSIWNPKGKTTKGGFQSRSDLFINSTGVLADLKKILWARIKKYRSEVISQDSDFIKMFPEEAMLSGWFVRLKKGGYQTEHIHPGGWLSGVIYLRVPKASNNEEGSIEFGLWGYNYPILDENYPRKQIKPKNGDLVLFPSSLFHRTIPFHSDKERVCIAFDLVPK